MTAQSMQGEFRTHEPMAPGSSTAGMTGGAPHNSLPQALQGDARIADARIPDEGCVPLNAGSLHDLLGPVNQICSITDLLLRKYHGTLDSEAEVLFGFIQGSAGRLRNLLGGLRTYAQMVSSRAIFRRCDSQSVRPQRSNSHAAGVGPGEVLDLHLGPRCRSLYGRHHRRLHVGI